ncbi:MAG: hypothetical protein KatS3mg090_0791 [Patescibacteria group bacterium]|nr:MAG: hypothetical protein KatS3mg090_0791 [Patescibacteria group bacterium]
MLNYALKIDKQKVNKKKSNLKTFKIDLDYLIFGWYIVIPIILFIGLGKFLIDKEVISKKYFIYFVLAGIASMIYNLVLFIKKIINGRKN